MRVRLAAAAATLTLAAGLVACGDDPPEAGTMDDNQSAENDNSPDEEEPANQADTENEPSEPVPEMPEDVPDEREEITFVKHYVDVYNYAIRTGDVDPLLELSTNDCDNCQSGAEWIRDIYDAGGHIENGEKNIVGDPLWDDYEDPPVVELNYEEDDFTVVESAGDEPTQVDGCPGITEVYTLEKEENQWQVTDLRIIDHCD